jgi:hypothetical protein
MVQVAASYVDRAIDVVLFHRPGGSSFVAATGCTDAGQE